jgi:dephospho-CoA kinase
MSAWTGKIVIGLTGNIGTGKSVVRRMLEHMGAYGIDADALAHRAIAKGAPGYAPVIDTFGKWLRGDDGQIDRARLGRVVFGDLEALALLESIIHPLVGQAVDVLVRRSAQKVIVIEAIKLLESSLAAQCDSIWVTYASPQVQLFRLIKKRNLNEATARQRIDAQPPQEQKIGAAQVVIKNDGSFEDTWRQVQAAWQKQLPGVEISPFRSGKERVGQFMVQRGRPRQANEIAEFINKFDNGKQRLTHEDIMAEFGEKAYLLLYQGSRLVGLVGWQVENLVARINEIFLDPSILSTTGLRVLIEEVERASKELQCEIALVFLPREVIRRQDVWRVLGYEERMIDSLKIRAWEEAAIESMLPGSVMLFKQLRKDRVLRPV